jgi:hypothetical protein
MQGFQVIGIEKWKNYIEKNITNTHVRFALWWSSLLPECKKCAIAQRDSGLPSLNREYMDSLLVGGNLTSYVRWEPKLNEQQTVLNLF